MSTLTSCNHGLEKGQHITMNVAEDRWWKRFFYWLIRKTPPLRKKRFVITKCTDSNTFEVKP